MKIRPDVSECRAFYKEMVDGFRSSVTVDTNGIIGNANAVIVRLSGQALVAAKP